jgi:hypothetical protein
VTIRGSIDHISHQGASGWAYDGRADQPLVVQALYDGRIIGEATAEQHRHDLAEAGFGDGSCGFAMNFYEAIDPALLPFVSIRPAGGDVELPRFAATGFADYFRNLHARHPGAGRSRSVFGGLWTDRTDSRPLLAGRIAAGTTPADLAAPLGSLIAEGFVVLPNALAPAGLREAEQDLVARCVTGQPIGAEGEARNALPALAELLFRDVALRPMRAALDDQPICTRIVPQRGIEEGFLQASTAEALPSPAECLLLVAVTGGSVLLDVVRGSHALPEFTTDGRSRWLTASPDATGQLAIAHGLSVDQVELSPTDLAIIGPGTLHRLRMSEGATGLRAWVLPRRVTPARFLAGKSGTFTLRHATGAMLAA